VPAEDVPVTLDEPDWLPDEEVPLIDGLDAEDEP
jgi:hypothetical protein